MTSWAELIAELIDTQGQSRTWLLEEQSEPDAEPGRIRIELERPLPTLERATPSALTGVKLSHRVEDQRCVE